MSEPGRKKAYMFVCSKDQAGYCCLQAVHGLCLEGHVLTLEDVVESRDNA